MVPERDGQEKPVVPSACMLCGGTCRVQIGQEDFINCPYCPPKGAEPPSDVIGLSTKPLQAILTDLQQYRRMQHRSFTRRSDGDTYTVLMFAHNLNGDVMAVVQLCAMAQIKLVIPIREFTEDFVQQDTATQPIVSRTGSN